MKLDDMMSIHEMSKKNYKYVAQVGDNYAMYDNGMNRIIAKPNQGIVSYKHFEVLRTEMSYQRKSGVQLNIPFFEYSYSNVFEI